MRAIKISIRRLPETEKVEIDVFLRELRSVMYRPEQFQQMRGIVHQMLNAFRPEPFLPIWTTFIWSQDAVGSPAASNRYIDVIMCNADLARLAYILDSEEGQFLAELLVPAWTRVTLCSGSSMFNLMHGKECILVVPDENLQLAREHGCALCPRLSRENAMREIMDRLDLMNHQQGLSTTREMF